MARRSLLAELRRSDTNVGILRGDGSPVGCRGVQYPEPNLFESGGAQLQNSTNLVRVV